MASVDLTQVMPPESSTSVALSSGIPFSPGIPSSACAFDGWGARALSRTRRYSG